MKIEIKEHKRGYIRNRNENNANVMFILQCSVNSQICLLNAWVELKKGYFYKAWDNVIDAQTYARYSVRSGIVNGAEELLDFLLKMERNITVTNYAPCMEIPEDADHSVIFLPDGEEDNTDGTKTLLFRENAINIQKLLEREGVRVLDVSQFYPEYKLLSLRGAEWYGPTLLFTASMLSQNPHLISITLSVIASYLYGIFSGKKEDVIAKFSFVTVKNDSYKKIDYNGPASGLKELEKIISEMEHDK